MNRVLSLLWPSRAAKISGPESVAIGDGVRQCFGLHFGAISLSFDKGAAAFGVELISGPIPRMAGRTLSGGQAWHKSLNGLAPYEG